MAGASMLLRDEKRPKSQGHISSYKKQQRASTLIEALKGVAYHLSKTSIGRTEPLSVPFKRPGKCSMVKDLKRIFMYQP